jgi:hypothetical protein
MRAIDRLRKLKEEYENSVTLEKFVSLTNPKNVALMEALVAWTCTNTQFLEEEEVPPTATMDDLWQLTNVSPRDFADTAGLSLKQGIEKMKQLKNLSLIFPDGTALSKATSIIKVYVKGKIEGLG